MAAASFEHQGMSKLISERSEVLLSLIALEHFFEGVAQGEERGRQAGLREGRQQGLQQGMQQGEQVARLETLRQAIVVVLASRRMAPSLAQLDCVLRCTSDAQLESWLRRACEVATVEELLGPQRPASVRSARRSVRGGLASSAAPARARRSR